MKNFKVVFESFFVAFYLLSWLCLLGIIGNGGLWAIYLGIGSFFLVLHFALFMLDYK